MLHALKSVARFLANATSINLANSPAYSPDESTRPGSALVASSTAATYGVGALIDMSTAVEFRTGTGDAPCYIGVTWAAQIRLDAVRYYSPTGWTHPLIKLQTWDGSTWTDETGSPTTQLVAGWNTIALSLGRYARGVRVVYVSGLASSELRCSEFDVRQDYRTEPAPAAWPVAAQIRILHPDMDLSSETLALLTIQAIAYSWERDDTAVQAIRENLTILIGAHCASEDQLSSLMDWARLTLDLAQAATLDGGYKPGIPLMGLLYPLTNIAGGLWWSSRQPDWFTSPAPIFYRNGGVVTPATIDYARGRGQITGSVAADDVRADFCCGVLEFDLRSRQSADITTPAQILHKHADYLVLESVRTRRIQNALA